MFKIVYMKKKIKKIISHLLPKGILKERIKLFYYRMTKDSNITYNLVKKNGLVYHKTTFSEIVMFTKDALYPVVHDFKLYQHCYKVKKNDYIIDAGANVGVISIFFSKIVGKYGKIFAFEPDKFNIDYMKNNIKLNLDIENNIFISNLLLWHSNTTIDFEEAGSEGSSAIWFSGNAKVVKKETVTIDSWVNNNNIQKLDFIKMDIEGAEIEALDGCVETIKTLKPNFAIASYHIVNGEPTYIKVEDFFKKLNYSYKTVTFKKNETITFAGTNLNFLSSKL